MYIVFVSDPVHVADADCMGKRFDQWDECAAYIKERLRKGNEVHVRLYV